jgi:hypothetical protein
MGFSRTSTVVAFVCLIQPLAFSQEPEVPYIEPLQLSSSDSGVTHPVQQLRAFYSGTTGLVHALQMTRISGRGWQFAKAGVKPLRQAVTNCLHTREAFLAEASGLNETNPEFWSRVIEAEMASEKTLRSVLDELLDPKQQKAFFIENARELSTVVFYSPLFWKLADVDEEQQNWLWAKHREDLMRSARIVSAKKVAVFTPVNRISALSVKQLEILLVLQARMEEDMSLEEYLELASPGEVEFFIRSNQSVRRLVETSSEKRRDSIGQPQAPRG